MTAIRNFYIKHRRRFFMLWTLLLMIIAAINFYFIFEVTYRPNDECLWDTRSKEKVIYFRNVKVEGVTWNAGIRDGDKLLKVNGEETYSPMRINEILLNLDGNIVNYTVERDGEIFETNVEIKRLISFNGLSAALFSTIWLLIGFVVVMSKHDGETQIVFFRIGAAFVLYSMLNILIVDNFHNFIYQSAWFFIPVDLLQVLGATYLPFLILHFFWVFPIRNKIMDKKQIYYWLYLTPVIIFGLEAIIKVTASLERLNFFIGVSQLFRGLFVFTLVSAGIASLVYLVKGFLTIKNKREKTGILLILISYIFTIAVAIYTLMVSTTFITNIYNQPYVYMPVILIILLPITFGYAVFRYSLLDVSDFLKNTILYGAATVMLGGLYFLLIYVLGQEISRMFSSEYQGIFAAGLFIIFALMFQSTKDNFQNYITKQFYPEQFAYQKVIYQFNRDISGVIGIEKIMDNTFSTFIEALKLNNFGIVTKNIASDSFKFDRIKELKNNKLSFSFDEAKLDKYIDDRIKTDQMPVIDSVQFGQFFPEFGAELIDEGIYTIIPMMIHRKIIGFLLFGLKYSGAKFSGKDIELLTTATNQIAIQLENARLYEQETENLKMHRDLENARLIQQNLLPSNIPDMSGLQISGAMVPAMMVGGDYYDTIKVSDTKMFIVIGDVSGKGLSASFYMSKLQTMVRLFCRESSTPKEVLTKLNSQMADVLQSNWFITVTVALFDTENKSIKLCRAGHTPTLLLKNNNRIFYTPAGMGVGIDYSGIFEKNLEEFSTSYEQDELYLFYSDGLTEAMNSKNELYGDDRLLRILQNNSQLSANDIRKKILDSLKFFRGAAPTNDDITMLVIKCV